ncbi:hypothetical protein [Synechococcus phage S-H34]|uniref:Uncharacterized protein n=1 Tax=Synechococcus phage S-H34 TaxID=2718942 RepID=A0A6G8R6K4_9CAUD|nr:hypothetical protein PQC15_gp145 [Synechococcus phage S-H34]QIN97016.1 hypothetical protein [Synechococcus phage S-H34]
MTFAQALDALEAAGYAYFGRLMMSGLDFDDPNGERLYLTEKQAVELAESL